jgi:nitrite reductase/ring-hydroxylating ferredoxin subunit
VTTLCPVASVTTELPVLARLTPTATIILLRQPNGTIVAWRNACPHMGIELDWDPRRLLTRDGRYLQCTGHGALFRRDNGLCVRGPCAGESLQPAAIQTENETVVAIKHNSD